MVSILKDIPIDGVKIVRPELRSVIEESSNLFSSPEKTE
jgi:hypothetical protein